MRAIFLVLALAACTQAPPPAETPVAAAPANADEATAQDTCGMAAFRHLVDTRALAADIDHATLPPGARIITPDSMVTQDFSPQRLNIFTDTDGRVSSLRCF
jgi:membrane-bound lytic murein transglycosylase B